MNICISISTFFGFHHFKNVFRSPNFLGRLLEDGEATSPVDRSSISYGSLGRNQHRTAPPLSPDQGVVDSGGGSSEFFRPIRHADEGSTKWESLSANEQNLVHRLAQLKFEGSMANSAVGVGAYRPSVLPDDPCDPTSMVSNMWLTPKDDLCVPHIPDRPAQDSAFVWPQAENAMSLPQRWTSSGGGSDANRSSHNGSLVVPEPVQPTKTSSVFPPMDSAANSLYHSAWGSNSCWSPVPPSSSANLNTGDKLWPTTNHTSSIWGDSGMSGGFGAPGSASRLGEHKTPTPSSMEGNNLLTEWIMRHERPATAHGQCPPFRADATAKSANDRWNEAGDATNFYGKSNASGIQQMDGLLTPMYDCSYPGRGAGLPSSDSSTTPFSTGSGYQTSSIPTPPAPGGPDSIPSGPALMAKLAAFANGGTGNSGSVGPWGQFSGTGGMEPMPPVGSAPPAPPTARITNGVHQPYVPQEHPPTDPVASGNQYPPASAAAAQMNQIAAAAALGILPPAVAMAYNQLLATGGRLPPTAFPPGHPMMAAANPFLFAAAVAAMAASGGVPPTAPMPPGMSFGSQAIPQHLKMGKCVLLSHLHFNFFPFLIHFQSLTIFLIHQQCVVFCSPLHVCACVICLGR